MARSLEGYKREIESLSDEKNLTLNGFMQNAVDSVAFNPSSTLDKNQDTKLPYIEEVKNYLRKTASQTKHTSKEVVKKAPEIIAKKVSEK